MIVSLPALLVSTCCWLKGFSPVDSGQGLGERPNSASEPVLPKVSTSQSTGHGNRIMAGIVLCFAEFHAAPRCTVAPMPLRSLHRFRTQTRFARWHQLCNAPSTVESQRRAVGEEQVGHQQGALRQRKCLALGGLAFENRWLLLDSRTMVTLFSCICRVT